MKSLRRSLNNNGASSSSSSSNLPSPPFPGQSYAQGINPLGRPSEKVAPPQKVIKALNSHRSTNPQELSYTKGDFWYVTGEREGWFEALNPLTGSRGLVPKEDFEEFAKGGRQTSGPIGHSSQPSDARSQTPSQGHLSQNSNPRSPPAAQMSPPIQSRKPKQPVYAIVQYDFQAERPDELDAKKGEPIVVIAQSNHEWFVAKPIGRLGGPGLIPVAFVEIRDPATGRPIDVLPESIPMVEEWKKATADYKAAAIPLGRFDLPPDQSVANSPYAPSPSQSPGANTSQTSLGRASSSDSGGQQNGQARSSAGAGPPAKAPIYRPEQDQFLPLGELTALGVPSFHNESGNYWFRLQVSYIPDDVSSSAFTLSLYRTYDDFYEFQISLLDTFPFEAGRPAKGEENRAAPERILPYMPGPVDGDEVDDELTEYRREELDAYVKALIDLRLRGAGYILRHELFRGFFAAKYGDYCEEVPRESVPRPEVVEELDERMGNMRVTDEPTQYIVDTRATSAASRHSQPHTDRDQQSPQSWGQSASRGASSRGPSPLPLIETQQVHAGGRPESSGYAAPHSASVSGHSHGHAPGHHAHGSGSGPVAASTPTSAGPGPSAGQQPSYIKIKIYDRTTDDLIAIRVHPSVSHAELFDKVRARLGPDIQVLRYRTGMAGGAGGAYKDLRDDRELREWLRIEDQKLVLYAEQ